MGSRGSAAVGMTWPENTSFAGYAYLGRGLGEHFEVGILPYVYVSNVFLSVAQKQTPKLNDIRRTTHIEDGERQ